MPSEHPSVCVFAPSMLATVTVERDDADFDEIHFHVGGQGFWVARMVRELGERPVLCSPVGGETGDVIRGLVRSAGVDFAPVRVTGTSPAYVHDRRNGDRSVVAEAKPPALSRHEVDDLFGKTLRHAIGAGVAVVTGRAPGETLGPDFYRRLGADLQAVDVVTIGDLHGDELASFLDGGRMDVLKVSDEDLSEDVGRALEDDGALWEVMAEFHERGVEAVIVSKGERGALALFEDRRFEVTIPAFEVVDHTGAGDSMTAALAVAATRGVGPEDMLALACAAGAANVTRHGLGSSQLELVERLADLVKVAELT